MKSKGHNYSLVFLSSSLNQRLCHLSNYLVGRFLSYPMKLRFSIQQLKMKYVEFKFEELPEQKSCWITTQHVNG